MLHFTALIALTLMSCGHPAYAAEESPVFTTEDLYKQCLTAVNWDDGGFKPLNIADREQAQSCWSFIFGYLHGYNYTMSMLTPLGPDVVFCIPPKVNSRQVARVFVQKIKDRPEIFHLSAGIGLAEALKSAYPCD